MPEKSRNRVRRVRELERSERLYRYSVDAGDDEMMVFTKALPLWADAFKRNSGQHSAVLVDCRKLTFEDVLKRLHVYNLGTYMYVL